MSNVRKSSSVALLRSLVLALGLVLGLAGSARADEAPASRIRKAQIMIGHPNNSGLQMDQVTQLYVPAFFVNELRLWQDDSLVLTMEGGISISEDPNIRFTYVSNGAKTFRAEAKDTEGHVFQREWKIDDSGI